MIVSDSSLDKRLFEAFFVAFFTGMESSFGTVQAVDDGSNCIKVKSPEGDVITIPVQPNTRTLDLKKSFSEVSGLPVYQQRIIFAGKQLEDDELLYDKGVRPGCRVFVVPQLKG